MVHSGNCGSFQPTSDCKTHARLLQPMLLNPLQNQPILEYPPNLQNNRRDLILLWLPRHRADRSNWHLRNCRSTCNSSIQQKTNCRPCKCARCESCRKAIHTCGCCRYNRSERCSRANIHHRAHVRNSTSIGD